MIGEKRQSQLNLFLFFITAKPQVLLIGQYSVGKTSFIRYLLGRDFPGQRIGPEPTTDRFTGTSVGKLSGLVHFFIILFTECLSVILFVSFDQRA